ncbi:hypothetical protein CP532_6910 [Ophiocordyceps camponoti-leonardi (nom. inval.)]|nr:hypothetical protein CP532_6910 [Ophiocordyceps camponoti-leonardi (nom. inval.)]
MTRPSIIRADTIDLQDHNAPSAQDHPDFVPGLSAASPARHHADTLREVALETAEEEARCPRASWTGGSGGRSHHLGDFHTLDLHSSVDMNDHHHQNHDALAIAQNGGLSSSDEGDADADADLDDDLMDKISSSPSIEDGGYSPVAAPAVWPPRLSSLSSFLRDPSAPVLPSRHLDDAPFAWTSVQHRPDAQWHCSGSNESSGPAGHDRDEEVDGEHDARHLPCAVPWARYCRLQEDEPDSSQRSVGSGHVHHGTHNGLSTVWEGIPEEFQDAGCYDSNGTPLMIPYEPSSEDEEDYDFAFRSHAHDTAPALPDNCLRDSEDIDFEFVYALHTFVATVEGQANATKGDTMMLLDDSNSYWWLVRVVKDSSIGYLPAEHIETPTERLARLNKHRNIDLSATMLGDQAQKPKNNSFKPMRRRRKTVAFAEPTYVDYSDFDYSTEEEEEDDDADDLHGADPEQADDQQRQNGAQRTTSEDEASDDGVKVEPLKTRSAEETAADASKADRKPNADDARDSDDSAGDKGDGPSKSRNGTVRNTDSFFKDDSVETKKITLTPNLLRDDNAPRESNESSTRDLKPTASLEKLDKELAPDKEKEKKKGKEKDKREKEKKPSAIRSFFTRKDKRKTAEDDDDSLGKRSIDTLSDSRDSEDRWDEQSPVEKATAGSKMASKVLKMGSTTGKGPGPTAQKSVELASYLAESRTNDMSSVPPASMRIVDPETRETQEVPSNQQQRARDGSRSRSLSTGPGQREGRSALSKVMPSRSASTGPPEGRQKTVKAKTRTPLESSDASDVSGAEEPEKRKKSLSLSSSRGPSPAKGRQTGPDEDAAKRQGPGEQANGHRAAPGASQQQASRRNVTERSQASPRLGSHPPALVADTSSPDGNSTDASSSPDQAQGAGRNSQRMVTSAAQREPAWDDTKLRAFFDEGDNIRDLLAVVYDKSDVEPAGSDHPVVGGLFREQNAKLAEITTQLDNMLGDWLARKQRLRGTI